MQQATEIVTLDFLLWRNELLKNCPGAGCEKGHHMAMSFPYSALARLMPMERSQVVAELDIQKQQWQQQQESPRKTSRARVARQQQIKSK